MPTGTALLDFGAPPGSDTATVAVTGQAAITAASFVEAWVAIPAAGTADHNADEHWVEELDVRAGNIVAGVGFTIYGRCRVGRTRGQFSVAWAWV